MVTSYRQLTSQQKQYIVEVFNGGLECRQIPNYLDVSIRAVSRVLAESGINTKRKNRYTLNESYFDKIDSQVKAYLLGLMAADGCVTSTNYVVLESIDRELVELLKFELKYSGQIRTIAPPGGHALHYRINFSSKSLASALSRYAVIAGRTESGAYYFPESKYLASYILGYFDGDGCAYVNKGRSGGLVCIVGSLEFTRQLSKLLNMGVVVAHQSRKVHYWRIYSRKHIRAFYEFIYQNATFGLNRKKEKIEQILKSYQYG
ncbi:MAG: LAGLIDADG family homing endonuclease [Cyanobacteriota bacterium]|nr:LAGLIDADG family homing endonuclease [Cyanobacteriota bacterium]